MRNAIPFRCIAVELLLRLGFAFASLPERLIYVSAERGLRWNWASWTKCSRTKFYTAENQKGNHASFCCLCNGHIIIRVFHHIPIYKYTRKAGIITDIWDVTYTESLQKTSVFQHKCRKCAARYSTHSPPVLEPESLTQADCANEIIERRGAQFAVSCKRHA